MLNAFLMTKSLRLAVILFGFAVSARAELKLPAIISDHMVLQQKQTNPIWGWDTPGTKVTVTFDGQTKSAEAGADGKWTVKLDPVEANAQPQTITIEGTDKKEIQDVLVGEVWMCSGQSNMGFTLHDDWNGDLEAAASKLPNLRLIKVPNVGTQDLKTDFVGAWKASDAASSDVLFGGRIYVWALFAQHSRHSRGLDRQLVGGLVRGGVDSPGYDREGPALCVADG